MVIGNIFPLIAMSNCPFTKSIESHSILISKKPSFNCPINFSLFTDLLSPQDDEEDFGTGKFAKYQKMMWDLIEKPDTRCFWMMMMPKIKFEDDKSVCFSFLLHFKRLLV